MARQSRGPLTIAEMRELETNGWRRSGRGAPELLDPAADECAPLFTSQQYSNCLTHITRVIRRYPTWEFKTNGGRTIKHEAYESATGWCGVIMTCKQITVAEASGFACWKCLERCAHLGLPTWSLIPDTGCAVSGGRRGIRRGVPYGPSAQTGGA